MDSVRPRRWILIQREAELSSEEDGASRWSVDHLFLDQDGIPTLVEVKRSSDTRIRREVVGQMLDYAANAVLYWPVEEIRAKFAARCELEGKDAAQELDEHLAGEMEAEQFWSQVKTNFQAGKIRMLFVADEIPSELRRIVEFLNQQMQFAEVLAVEIRQFAGEGLRTLVPRLFGQTAEAERAKSRGTTPGREWNETSYFSELEVQTGSGTCGVARQLLEWARNQGCRVSFGRGSFKGQLMAVLNHGELAHRLFLMGTNGKIRVLFQYLRRKEPFTLESKRVELLKRLNQIPGIAIPADSIDGMPLIPLHVLSNEQGWSQFAKVMDWVVEEIKHA